MKAASLLILRVSTGALLVIWGLIKIMSPQAGVGVSDKYYGGAVSLEALQLPWGVLQVAVGLLVVLGLLRKIVYPLQAAMLVLGALVIWKYLVDPLGMYLLDRETSQVLFFPSLTVAAATLVMLAFKDEDRLALDVKLRGRRGP